MLLNLDFKFKDLEDKEIEGNTAAKLLADFLSNKTTGAITSIKAMDWALKLFSVGEIEIDRADTQSLEKLVKSFELANILEAPILLAIKALKD